MVHGRSTPSAARNSAARIQARLLGKAATRLSSQPEEKQGTEGDHENENRDLCEKGAGNGPEPPISPLRPRNSCDSPAAPVQKNAPTLVRSAVTAGEQPVSPLLEERRSDLGPNPRQQGECLDASSPADKEATSSPAHAWHKQMTQKRTERLAAQEASKAGRTMTEVNHHVGEHCSLIL
jgi:hypothetical protein